MINKPSTRSRSGQALIEVFFIVILFIFVGIMAYETGVMYYNVNAVSNSLKQAVWLASGGATDEKIMAAVADVDTYLMKSALFEHRIENFGIEVWIQSPGSNTEYNIAPTSCDNQLSPAPFPVVAAIPTRAAYVWRAHNLNIRVGLTYRAGYVAPYFGAAPTFLINLPLTASEPITARNDEDRDGLVDLYEQEFFSLAYTTWPPLALAAAGPWPGRPFHHTDSVAKNTDDLDSDIDGDGLANYVAAESGVFMFDRDNDGISDVLDPKSGHLRHPRLGMPNGGGAIPLCP